MSNLTDRTEINRNNARHSTGPRTPEGKARSSKNATRSGWFSQTLRVAAGKEQIYADFEQAWLDELQPEGILELEAVHDFVRAQWHKREVIQAQNELGASFMEDAAQAKLDRFHRYERTFELRAARALAELRKLQTHRALLHDLPDECFAAAPPLASAKSLVQKRTEARSGEDLSAVFDDLGEALRQQPDQQLPPVKGPAS